MTNLRQCANSLTVVGTLKSKEVKFGTTANGDATITLDLVVVSDDNGTISENKVSLWAKNTSKLYNGYVTVANEYKTIDENGADSADRVKITGSLEMNEYFSSAASELKTYNKLKGVFVNRDDKNLKDEVGAVVECVITGMSDEISKEGTPTGRKKVQILTVGYQGALHEIQNVVVQKELAQQFAQMYQINSTGKLFIKINNYVEKVEQPEETKPQLGFGTTLSNMPDTVINNYINELVIVGGDMPNVANRFTVEQIGEMKRQRELSKQEKMNGSSSSPTPPAPSGFGAGFGTGFGTPNDTPATNPMDDIPF